MVYNSTMAWGGLFSNHGKILCIPWFGGCYSYSNMTEFLNIIDNYKFAEKTILRTVPSIILG